MARALLITSIVVLAALIFTPATTAQQIDPGGTLNGHFWRTLDNLNKLLFLNGYASALTNIINEDGRIRAKSQTPADSRYFSYYPASMSYQDVSSALDRLYEDPANDPIILPHAIEVISLRASGLAGEASIQERIEFYRAVAKKLDRRK